MTLSLGLLGHHVLSPRNSWSCPTAHGFEASPLDSHKQHAVVDRRTTGQKIRILTRFYIDRVDYHALILLACLTQCIQYFRADSRAVLATTGSLFAVLNVLLLIHFGIDLSTQLVYLLTTASPNSVPPKGELKRGDAKVQLNDSITTNPRPARFGRLCLGSIFDMTLACFALLYGLPQPFSRPLFPYRLFGYGVRYHRLITLLRSRVAFNKRLFEGPDDILDLTYVTNRVIASALPAVGKELLCRNPIEAVAAHLRQHHPGCHLMVNTCAEHDYDEAYFHRVCVFPCADHEVMPLGRMIAFCKILESFLGADPDAVVAVHCLGGKGRTGLVLSAWLLFSGFCKSSEEALCYYGMRRTDDLLPGYARMPNNKCQIRFIKYFEMWLHKAGSTLSKEIVEIPTVPLRLRRLVIRLQATKRSEVATATEALAKFVVRIKGLFPHTKHRRPRIDAVSPWDFLKEEDVAMGVQEMASRKSGKHLRARGLREGEVMDSTRDGGVTCSLEADPYGCSYCYFDWSPSRHRASDPPCLTMAPNRALEALRLGEGATEPLEGSTVITDASADYSDACRPLPENERVVNGEFGITVGVGGIRSDADSAHHERVALLWLHSSFLSVGIPPEAQLQAMRTRQPHCCGRRDDRPLEYYPSFYQEVKTGRGDSTLQIVGYILDDMDVRNHRLNKFLEAHNFHMFCFFEVLK